MASPVADAFQALHALPYLHRARLLLMANLEPGHPEIEELKDAFRRHLRHLPLDGVDPEIFAVHASDLADHLMEAAATDLEAELERPLARS